MLAGLTAWVDKMLSPLRSKRLFPIKGDSYEQFDLATLLFVLILCNYILASPAPTTQAGLSWLLGDAPLVFWRIFLITGASIGLLTSYAPRWHSVGLGALWLVGFVWASVLLVGWIAEPTPPLFASSVLYGFFARHAYRLAKRGA